MYSGGRVYMNNQFVTYLRVSTRKQELSNLGLLAQEEAINNFVDRKEGSIIGTFKETESGKNDQRPELAKAIELCKLTNSTLLIAKLDRLARSVHFVSSLMKSEVNFIACDNEHANKLTIHLLSSINEFEREIISTRVKEALKQAKLRGTKLGTAGIDNLTIEGTKMGIINSRMVRSEKADIFARTIDPIIQNIQNGGVATLKGIASELNNRNIRTARSGLWTGPQVARIKKRIKIRNKKGCY
jgi:DNA invertase Pin-like site-specific DNA recombinase